MATRCQRCGNVNDALGSKKYCDVCRAPLPPPESPATEQIATVSGDNAEGQVAASTAPTIRDPRARYPVYRPAPSSRTIRRPASPIVRPSAPASSPVAPAAADYSVSIPNTATGGQAVPTIAGSGRACQVEGTVERVDNPPEEPPDPDVARILMSLIIAVDLILMLGSTFLAIMVGAIVVLVLASLLGAGWIVTIFGFLFQSVFYFLSPVFQALIGGRNRQQTVPVTNYLVVDASGRQSTVRVKGRLRGASIGRGDRICVRGRWRYGVLRLQGGEKIDTGEPLLPERSLSWLWLLLVVAANVAGYAFLADRLPLR